MDKIIITGPFRQMLTMDHLPVKGALRDSQIEIIEEAGIVCSEGKILDTGKYGELCGKYGGKKAQAQAKAEEKEKAKFQNEGKREIVFQEIDYNAVVLPGFVDPHTHICWAGSRANDYALRLEGKSYTEISQNGGGIWNTVTKTRLASANFLLDQLKTRAKKLISQGITTVEVKSGYCLNLEGEIKLLEVINEANKALPIDLIPTCLAAHIPPRDFSGSAKEYLNDLVKQLFPILKNRNLTNRIDIFVENGAFTVEEAREYLKSAKEMGFDIVIHGDQFTSGGAALAVELGAKSVDHLEVADDTTIKILSRSDVVPVALPGASLGLGCNFAPARKLLDAGCCLAIGSDWNPGSAPMGDLLVQAAILGAYEKLSMAETFAGITFRSAYALGLNDRGILKSGYQADFIAFPVTDYKEILYHQGMVKPAQIWKNGIQIQSE
jgi:imidazolonepropionase